jgi:DNA-binding XRE family transcriptional regulator
MTPKDLGKQIKILRVKNSLLQKDLAKILGCKPPCIIRWETGRTWIPTRYLMQLVERYDLKITKETLK